MDLALELYNNHKVLGEWNPRMSKMAKLEETKDTKTNRKPKYLALLTWKLQMLITKLSKTNQGKNDNNVIKNRKGRVILIWRVEHAKGEKMMTQNNTVFNWCTNNCHAKPLWYTCNPCYNQANFKKKMKEENRKEDKS
eukprot:4942190-Ditylum_brightwellii.AAC.1